MSRSLRPGGAGGWRRPGALPHTRYFPFQGHFCLSPEDSRAPRPRTQRRRKGAGQGEAVTPLGTRAPPLELEEGLQCCSPHSQPSRAGGCSLSVWPDLREWRRSVGPDPLEAVGWAVGWQDWGAPPTVAQNCTFANTDSLQLSSEFPF